MSDPVIGHVVPTRGGSPQLPKPVPKPDNHRKHLLMRMAGNIAAGLANAPPPFDPINPQFFLTPALVPADLIAMRAVEIALAIEKCVDAEVKP